MSLCVRFLEQVNDPIALAVSLVLLLGYLIFKQLL
jgi:hypothetical protein